MAEDALLITKSRVVARAGLAVGGWHTRTVVAAPVGCRVLLRRSARIGIETRNKSKARSTILE